MLWVNKEGFLLTWAAWLYLFNIIFMLIIAIREVRKPATALNWLIISLILPVIGFIFYLSTAIPLRIRRERLTAPHNETDVLPDSFSPSALNIAHGLRHMSVHGLRAGQVQVLTNGIETYERLIKSIQNAKSSIDLEYYIYRDDQIGRRITDLLIEKASVGVRVRLVKDGWGSKQFPKALLIRMIEAGIECRTFFPARFPWIISNWNYRDHCKIVIIDGEEAFTGGINIGYEYTGLKPNIGFWRDTHIRIIGEAKADLQAIFDVHWNIATPEQIKIAQRKTRTVFAKKPVKGIAEPGYADLSRLLAEWSTELGARNGTSLLHKAYIQTLEGNPGIPTQFIREAYFICLTQATHTIDITTPYFLPDADIIMALKTAVARGVRVRLLLPRKMEPSTKIVGAASQTYFGELLEAGVHIYLYNKGILHAKLMIIDEEICEIGAANFDMRSFRLNYEVCEVLYSADIARELTAQFERDLNDSVPLRMVDVEQRTLPQRILDQGARLFSPML
jgi:cardiolipin synthase A/B